MHYFFMAHYANWQREDTQNILIRDSTSRWVTTPKYELKLPIPKPVDSGAVSSKDGTQKFDSFLGVSYSYMKLRPVEYRTYKTPLEQM